MALELEFETHLTKNSLLSLQDRPLSLSVAAEPQAASLVPEASLPVLLRCLATTLLGTQPTAHPASPAAPPPLSY